MKKVNQIVFLFFIFLFLFSFAKFTFADTNGIWTLAQDVRGGIFGLDEQNVKDFYSFINPVYFYKPINITGIYSTYSKDYYINLSGRSQLNNIATNGVSTNSLELNNLKSCSGKLYTDSNGNVVCGTDNVNDADSDPTNELQNLYQVLSRGNNAGGQKITNLGYPYYSSDAATKSYVDNKVSSSISNINLNTVLNNGNNAGGKTITGLPTPTSSSDAATKGYVDSKTSSSSNVNLNSVLTNGNDAGGHKITNLGNPSVSSDAVNLGTLNNKINKLENEITELNNKLNNNCVKCFWNGARRLTGDGDNDDDYYVCCKNGCITKFGDYHSTPWTCP